jgi:hypothetical protein
MGEAPARAWPGLVGQNASLALLQASVNPGKAGAIK